MRNRILQEVPITGENANTLVVKLIYNEGGMNWATSREEKRGLYLHVSPVNIQKEKGYQIRTTTAFTGVKKLVKEMKRFSRKTLDNFEVDSETLQKVKDYVMGSNGLKYNNPS